MSTLLDLRQGDSGTITKVKGRGAFRKRITEMGFVKGKSVIVIKAAPLQDPIEYKILGYHVSLRQSEARLIEVYTGFETDDQKVSPSSIYNYSGTFVGESQKNPIIEKGKVIDIALVGNPNCGKPLCSTTRQVYMREWATSAALRLTQKRQDSSMVVIHLTSLIFRALTPSQLIPPKNYLFADTLLRRYPT